MPMRPLTTDDPVRMGSYRLLARLGSGGMGRVYLARSPGGRWAAVKVVRPEFAGDARFRARFRREVAAARRVDGAFTAPVLDADADGEEPWLATAYVAGPSLQEAVGGHGPLDEAGTRSLGAGLAEALLAVHRAGLVHRDLKPSNVLLTADGPRVIDFGISRVPDATAMTAAGSLVGTPSFMSPEQAEGNGEITAASDVFSLGGVLVFAATGTGPFGSGPADAVLYRVARQEPLLDAVPGPLRPVLAACLSKAPADRPSPEDLLDLLTGGAAPDPAAWLSPAIRADLADREGRLAEFATLPPEPAGAPVRAGVRRRRVIAVAAGVAGTALAGGAAAAWRIGASGGTGRGPGRPAGAEDGTGSLVGARTGPRPLWTFAPAQPSDLAGLTTTGGLVHLAGHRLDAIDASSGRRRWSYDTGGLRADVAGSEFHVRGTGGAVHVLDAATGRRRRTVEDDALLPAFQIIGWTGDLLCFLASGDGPGDPYTANLFDTRRRRALWRKGLAGDVHALILGPDACYVRDEAALYALALDDGRERWRAPYPANRRPRVIRSGGLLFTATPEGVAAHEVTGRRRWTARITGGPTGAVALAGGVLCCAMADGVVALDPATGARRWHTPGPAALATDSGHAPALSAALVAVNFDRYRTSAGFAVLDAEDGAVRWTLQTSGDRGTNWRLAATTTTVFAYDGVRLHAFRG
ncbi:protein kinase domain-containing protein [Actinomadura rugatobispora]|uniref:PQQ-binding-like beta-propeller repeat protein n=1 Tax=Actinomadura rugatobispora TaxID=1994 RepID=A0ABW1A4Y0_9ACTN|nr:hypothetical protein GCM10010200_107260 [Actinomadura rugatobispora]